MNNTIYKLQKGVVITMVKIAELKKGASVYMNNNNGQLSLVQSYEVSEQPTISSDYYANDDHAEKAAISWHEDQIRILKLHLKEKGK